MPNAKLSYRATPPAAFVSTKVDITVTATNTGDADIKLVKNDEIQIAFPATMVDNQNFTVSTPPKSGYSAAKSTAGDYFSVKAPFGLVLKPGDVMTITFSQAPIVSTPTTGINIVVSEFIGTTTPALVNLPFEVKSAGLGIIAWLDKMIVGELQPSTLYWQSSGGTQVVISGYPTGTGQKTCSVKGNTQVYVPVQASNPQQWKYTLQVFTGDGGSHEETSVTLQVNPPIINSFVSAPINKTIRVDASVELSWLVQFASSVILTTPTIPNWRQPINANPYKTVPGADIRKAYWLNAAQVPDTVDYILSVNGFLPPAPQTITFHLEPVKLLYFKFTTKGGNVAVFKTDPANWNTALKLPNNENPTTFTIFQPGGKADVYYLGGNDKTHPQIPFFDFSKNAGKFTLEWVTANLKTLVLNPNNVPITGDQIVNGKLDVDSPGVYTLTGTTEGGLTVDSVLEVVA